MEVKINKEIREYTEAIFFGLSLRQCVFAALAILVAAGLFMILKASLGLETVSWVCLVAAAPFAAAGFVTYNGMSMEKFVSAWLRARFFMPKRLVFGATNVYYETVKLGKGGKRK
jgi:hypothetical protein